MAELLGAKGGLVGLDDTSEGLVTEEAVGTNQKAGSVWTIPLDLELKSLEAITPVTLANRSIAVCKKRNSAANSSGVGASLPVDSRRVFRAFE